MYIEDRLNSIETKLDFLVKLQSAIPANESGVAGAGAEPVVAQQVNQAIAAAGGVSGQPAAEAPKRGRGRPSKTEIAPPVVTAPTTPPVSQPDPFALTPSAPAAPAAKPRTIEEVKAALLVYGQNNGQAAALELLKTVGKVETLAVLAKADASIYPTLFKAAIPADKFDISDVRVMLVAAEARKAGRGMDVLHANGAADINQLTEDKFVKAILDAHVAGRN